MSESFAYRENLEQILQFTGGKNLLNISEVSRFTGISDRRTVKAPVPVCEQPDQRRHLARCMCGSGKQ